MGSYYIYIRDNTDEHLAVEVKGTERAYEVYRRACDFAEVANLTVSLVYDSEIIADNTEEEE